jgi:hypothetical protein
MHRPPVPPRQATRWLWFVIVIGSRGRPTERQLRTLDHSATRPLDHLLRSGFINCASSNVRLSPSAAAINSLTAVSASNLASAQLSSQSETLVNTVHRLSTRPL